MTRPAVSGHREAAMTEKSYYVYILLCERDLLYTGYTDDIPRRMRDHLGGRAGAKFTRSFRPFGIVQCWLVGSDKSAALKIERYIKKMTREMKQKLIVGPERLGKMLRADIGLDSRVTPCLNEPPVSEFSVAQSHNRQ